MEKGGVIFINFYAGFVDSTFEAKYKALLDRRKPELDELRAKLKEEGREWEYWRQRGRLLKSEVEEIRPPLEMLIDHFDYIAKLVGSEHVGLGSDFDGVSVLPKGIDDVTDLPKITASLLERGYSRGEVEMMLGGNLLRVFAEATGSSEHEK